jgi:hypothetical protein
MVQVDTVSGARLPARDLSESQPQQIENLRVFASISPRFLLRACCA